MNIEQIRAAAGTASIDPHDPSCIKISVSAAAADSNADVVADRFRDAVDRAGLKADIIRAGSFGLCDLEPIVTIEYPGPFAILYRHVTPDAVADLVDTLAKGLPGKIDALCCVGKNEHRGGIPQIDDLPLFSMQNRIALRNCGLIDPEDINHYIVHGRGYTGLSNALLMNPTALIKKSMPAALRGRGGPGCSAAHEWERFAALSDVEKYLVCDAIDPDPQSSTSRLLLESDPHSVLEGMLIGAYASGATGCFILVQEKTTAGQRLRKALNQMSAYNLLGSDILDSEFCAEITIEEVPAVLTTGYRIELFRCLEEKQPLPHMHPGWLTASQLAGKPVITVNPEVLSSLSALLFDGGKERRESKVVALSGSIAHPSIVEVSTEMTLRSIIDAFGGGCSHGKAIKAVQLGGMAGPFVGPDALDFPIGCYSREESGSCIASGAINVLDTGMQIVAVAKEIMTFLQAQSCGKCVFCREGCLQMLTILEDISENRVRPHDVDLLVELGEEMLAGCLCGFGRAVPGPVLSSIKLFRKEFGS
jgi:NADH-quinone oxidoreductase subunit F